MDLFEQRLLAEGVRAIEGDSPSLSASGYCTSLQGGFESRLLARAVELDGEMRISTLLVHFKGLVKHLSSLLALFLFILGATSVQQLFFSEQGTQINFFWAFALFFIPNLLSLFLWLVLFCRANLLNTAWLARFSLFLFTSVEKRFNPQARQEPHFWPVFRSYFKVNFSGFLGRYQLSALSHLLWLSYFLGAILMLIMMLATHQVDFVWQTSLLSLESFQWLTKLLASIPSLLGFSVPDSAVIQHSNITLVNSMADAEQNRFAWSSLLISSLIIYGLLPRFFLWGAMVFFLARKKLQFRLALSHPYYVQLRQQLKPNVTSLGISDPDLVKATPSVQIDAEIASQAFPASFFPVAIELSQAELISCEKHVKQRLAGGEALLKNICDFQEQQALITRLSGIAQASIVLYVSIARVPDRGLSGFIGTLTRSGNKSFYLLLIDEYGAQLNKRRSDWYHLAAQTNIPLDNIIHLKTGKMESYE